jgi:8-oxo-dGTP diphosphatase
LKGPVLVAGAVIWSDSKLLITQRRHTDLYGGLWEFPGGKVEYGEDPRDCLVREIKEELDCVVHVDSLLDVSSFIYPDGRHYVIVFYNCSLLSGSPKSLEHEDVRWVSASELKDYGFAEADRQVVEKIVLSLPFKPG